MSPKAKKILFIGVTVTVIGGIGLFLYMRSKNAALGTGPDGESLASMPSSGVAEGSWKRGEVGNPNDAGDAVNKYHVWGYAKDNLSGGTKPAPYPRIKIFTPDGKQYGEEYIGDAGGVYSLWVPDETYVTEITAPGYMVYKNAASKISNGYKLFMRKVGEA